MLKLKINFHSLCYLSFFCLSNLITIISPLSHQTQYLLSLAGGDRFGFARFGVIVDGFWIKKIKNKNKKERMTHENKTIDGECLINIILKKKKYIYIYFC